MTSPETIAELKRLMKKARPKGNLTVEHVGFRTYISVDESWVLLAVGAKESYDSHAPLAAAAVNALPSLLSDLEASQKREQVLREALKDLLQTYETAARSVIDRATGTRLIDLDKKYLAEARAALAATEGK
jgi:hypothetical protein